MELTKRVQMIGLLQNIFLKEAAEDFIRNNKNQLSIDKNSEIQNIWYNYSASFTSMWLSYLPDDKLEEILSKKIAEQNTSGGINMLFGKN